MEPRGLGLAISTPIMAPVQISKKQTVVGNTYFKVFFFYHCQFEILKVTVLLC